MSKITDIAIDPYNSPPSSLTVGCMIAEETGAELDPGLAGGPFYLCPESVEQFNETLDLCKTFELCIIRPVTDEQLARAREILGKW